MNTTALQGILSILVLVEVFTGVPCRALQAPGEVTSHWDKTIRVLKTSATLQVVTNPLLRRGSSIHNRVYQAIHDLGCDYVRYVPWLPYPKLGVAELEPPQAGKTFWDFSRIDPMTEDFMNATAGHPAMLNFSIIPQWMFKTDSPVPYPADPDQVIWDYQRGTEFRDPSLKELAGYYARLVSWYTKGGFTDESGKWRDSGHQYPIAFWEVLNEADDPFEHQMTPETYTRVYDAIVEAIRAIQPQMKFVGLALAGSTPAVTFRADMPRYFEYFLDPKNHRAQIPIDMISYHFYAIPGRDETIGLEPYNFFDQADHFLDVVRYIEKIRQRLSPTTRTTLDEIGTTDAGDFDEGKPGYVFKEPPQSYWNLSAALFAYVYARLAQQGIDVVAESQIVGFPTQFPSVSMVDWNSGQPNVRYWVLKLIHDNFAPGDNLVETASTIPYVFAQGFVTHDGKRKLLLVNKRDRSFELLIPGSSRAEISYLDKT